MAPMMVISRDEPEHDRHGEHHRVPAAGLPLFQAATANLNPWTEVKVNSKMPDRGHALTIDSGWREVADTAPGFVQRFVTP
jgi:non-heme chloroperoxidase